MIKETLCEVLLVAMLIVPSAQAQNYVRYADPREGAFTIDVPANWQVEGGLLRYSPLAYNFVMSLTSPDGQKIQIGDPDILPYTAPGPGVPPIGSKYPVGQGVVLLVQPYMTGTQFARTWGGSVLRQGCSDLRLLEASDVSPSPSGSPSDRSGLALFACGARIAFVFATTHRLPGPAEHWQAADSIIGLARPEQIRNTVAIIFHMIGTARITPQWMIQQLQRSGTAIGAAQQQTEQLMRDQERKSVNTPGSVSYQIDQSLRGYTSTPGGNEVEVQGHGNYYWNCGGHQVNTPSYTPPNPSCTPIR